MRSRGQLRLLMNANLWPDMKITAMDGGKVPRMPPLSTHAKGPVLLRPTPKLGSLHASPSGSVLPHWRGADRSQSITGVPSKHSTTGVQPLRASVHS